MTKQEFINTVSERFPGIPKAKIEGIMSETFGIITTNLEKGEKVAWPGFGRFEAIQRKARTGRNPKTGASLEIPASVGVKFKAGKKLKDRLNG
jgi:DNA-binding protein HU-beta